jgi:hypothetical protein
MVWQVSLMRQMSGAMSARCLTMPPNLSLNPDASPAALTRRPLGAG